MSTPFFKFFEKIQNAKNRRFLCHAEQFVCYNRSSQKIHNKKEEDISAF